MGSFVARKALSNILRQSVFTTFTHTYLFVCTVRNWHARFYSFLKALSLLFFVDTLILYNITF